MNIYTTEQRIYMFDELMGNIINDTFRKWLVDNGFFTAPASKSHHGSYEGGLFDHSYEVARTLVKLTKDNNLKWTNSRSPYIVGMFHDLCKIDAYKLITGVVYEYNDDVPFLGHGDKSIMYLASQIKLTHEEVMCIRWHMGAFDDKENWKYYSSAVKDFPNVLWTHQADMIVSQIFGV